MKTVKEVNDENALEVFEDKEYEKKLSNIFLTLKNKQKYDDDIKETYSLEEASVRLDLDTKAINAFINEAKQNSELKKVYAIILLLIFILQLIAFNTIFILAGLNILAFTETTLNVFVTGGLIEVIALITIIVKYLFNDNITESLNNILKNNKKK